MNLVTISGPPSSGKTSVILKTIEAIKKRGLSVGVVKFDCLYTDDDILYEKAGVPVKKGLFCSPSIIRSDKKPTCAFYKNKKGDTELININ